LDSSQQSGDYFERILVRKHHSKNRHPCFLKTKLNTFFQCITIPAIVFDKTKGQNAKVHPSVPQDKKESEANLTLSCIIDESILQKISGQLPTERVV
jgi:hypothetical protein